MNDPIQQLDAAILPVLEGIQVDSETLFVDVLQTPPDSVEDFSGFPSAAYYYGTTDSDYSTQQENRRDYFFDIYLYGIYENKTLREQYVLMYKMVDATINALDLSDDLGLDKFMIRPAPSEMVRVTSERGDGLRTHIRLKCSIDTPR